MLAIIATNAGSNSLPVGADVSGLWPRWINIVRGQVICAALAPLLVPWKIIASAQSFLTFLGSYTVFLMPTCGVSKLLRSHGLRSYADKKQIMIVDYWVIRRGNFHVPSLFTKDPDAPYTYHNGWNFRAIAAWVAGVAFTVHGIAGNLDPDAVNDSSKNMYRLGFLLSLLMGATVYYAACLIWPLPVYPTTVVDGPMEFEAMAESEGFLERESPDTIRGIIRAVTPEDQDGLKGSAQQSVSEKYSV